MPSRAGRAAGIGAIAAGGAFVLTGAALTIGARVLARFPLVPQESVREDAEILAIGRDRVALRAVTETLRPGVLALRQGGGGSHLRLGRILDRPTPDVVVRELLAVDTPGTVGAPRPGPAATNGFFWSGDPQSAHGMDMREVQVQSPAGQMPAWLVPAPEGSPSADTWAILVHGHGATRGEGLRVIPLLHELGLTSLTITYRNDAGAPASADRMHHLGLAEWEDAEAAIEHALAAGARRIVLMGWSMGGGIVLRTSVLTAHPEVIAALVLDSPAVDWQDILEYHARMLRAPRAMRALALWMMRSRLGARLVRLHEPLALAQMRPEFYAAHLEHPVLLLHADEDRMVPQGPSAALAALREDLISYVPFARASHTREWNTDPARTEEILAGFLVDVLGLELDIDALALPIRDPGAAPQERSSGMRL